MKNLFCAACGMELDVLKKANPSTGRLMNLVVPHTCREYVVNLKAEELPDPEPGKLMKVKESPFDEVFGKLPFADKINEASKPSLITDRRPPEAHRKELDSTAPAGLSQYIKGSGGVTAPVQGRELEEPDE